MTLILCLKIIVIKEIKMSKKCKLDNTEKCAYCGECQALEDADIKLMDNRKEDQYIKESGNFRE
jgi:hypothetical protein